MSNTYINQNVTLLSVFSFFLYNKNYIFIAGVYYDPACSSSELNHSVLVVGYGTDGGSDYWLVKNSWDTAWGDGGYIKMSHNRGNNCAIATYATYPLV